MIAGLKTCTAAAIAIALTACHVAPRQVRVPAPAAPANGAQPAATPPLTRLQHDLDALLTASPLAHGYWGVLAKSLDTDETLYALNAHRLLMPASTMKIVTIAAAGERLGWDYRYETRLVGTGPIEGGVLNGDLLVIGSGDPSIVEREGMSARLFEHWAEQLKAAGVRTIAGRIIGDDNSFDDEALGFGWSWDDLAEGYAAAIGALQYNENTVDATIAPGALVGDPAAVTIAPGGSGLVVHNGIRTTPAGTAPSIAVRRLAGSSRLELRGSAPLGGAPTVRPLSVVNPTLFFLTALGTALAANGIDVRGPAEDIDDLPDAPGRNGGPSLVIHRSASLATLAVTLMKESRNLYAETFLKTTGDAAGVGTSEHGRAATMAVLQRWGLPAGELIQMDGSGLSRYDYVTAATLVGILTRARRDDMLRGTFEASLPIAGRDGTLAERMKDTAAEGNARAKTGSMSNVRALAGYVTTADGEPVAFAVLANNFETPPEVITRTIDAMVVRLAEFRRQ